MSAQEYLDKLAAEHQKSVDDYRALQEAKEQERTDEFRQQANMALESFNYQRAIALALVEVAHQLGEIDKTLVSMHSL